MRNMMKTRYKQLFACVAALLSAISVPAQDLPLLPGDPAVKQGVLPNGMTYYLSNNPSTKGKADFALVQKTGRLTTGDSADSYPAELARNTLDYVPRLGGRSPQDFILEATSRMSWAPMFSKPSSSSISFVIVGAP